MILVMDEQGIVESKKQPRISVVYVNYEMQKKAMSLASKLRQKHIPVDVDLFGKSLSKQMEIAADSSYSIIVGPKELAQDSVLLRNMKDGIENMVHIKNLLADPKTILNL
jgi:histidyl-tRNA synthetase